MEQEYTLERAQEALKHLRKEISKVLVGQDALVEALGLALLCGQHVLIEGVPGLAKTLAVRSLAETLGLDFQRIQFTPDLLPSDLVGTQIFNPQKGDFSIRKGPIFANLILADEINRAPAKVQSALLEAMEERQVTLGDETFPLPQPFMVLATQNPIEQEGTYALPEAQLDRFMFKVRVGYPSRTEELDILKQKKKPVQKLQRVLESQDLQALRSLTEKVHLEEKLEEYIVDLVRATRNPKDYGLDLEEALLWGSGPRGIVFFLLASRAKALWEGRDYCIPSDIQSLAPLILGHRILLSYEALAEGLTSELIIKKILDGVEAP